MLIKIKKNFNKTSKFNQKNLTDCCTEEFVIELLNEAEKQGIIHKTIRNFANEVTLCFVSLRIEIISYECISWVLRSLSQDEMTPSEKTIHNRIKEAFAHEVDANFWIFIQNQI